MKTILTFLFVVTAIVCSAQDHTSKYNDDRNCYALEQQQSLNICLAEQAEKLKKRVEEKYNCILNYLQREIESCEKETCEDLNFYKKNKNDLIRSQVTWNTLRLQNATFWEGGGGSITNQYIAESLIKDCKDRLKWLDSIIEEAGQGQTAILKCD